VAAPSLKLRIFISYGRDQYAALAARLYRDLSTAGHDTWFDADRLAAGSDWERSIEDGLQWIAEAPDRSRFVLLMTPHAVRRPDGYCLNELAWALARKVPVIPVMVVGCEPPLSISRLQWYDMTSCVPYPDHEPHYLRTFPGLVRAIDLGHPAPPLALPPSQAERLARLFAMATPTDRFLATQEGDPVAKRLPTAFPVGTAIRLTVEADIPCHCLLFNIDEGGEVKCLCPSWFAPAPSLQTGSNHFPQKLSCYPAFHLSHRPGRELLLAVLSDRALFVKLMPTDQRTPAGVLTDRQIDQLVSELRKFERNQWEVIITHIDVELPAPAGKAGGVKEGIP
jgi:TIR domain/Domain of unknown function (DUF4384)